MQVSGHTYVINIDTKLLPYRDQAFFAESIPSDGNIMLTNKRKRAAETEGPVRARDANMMMYQQSRILTRDTLETVTRPEKIPTG